MANLLTTATSGIKSVQNVLNGSVQAVVRPNKTNDPSTVDPTATGFIFDIPTGEKEELESDTTDHYTESGSFLNDHIVNKPIRITLNGLVGELVYRLPAGWLGTLRQVSGRLAGLAALEGNYTPGFVQKVQGILGNAQAAANLLNQYLQTAQSIAGIASSFYGPHKITSQKNAYNVLYGLWIKKTIFTISTPWADHPAMVIENMGFTQDQDSNDYSTIIIKFKEFRFAATKFTKFNGSDVSTDVTSVQNSAAAPQGPAGTSNTTTLYDLNQSGALKGKLTGFGSP